MNQLNDENNSNLITQWKEEQILLNKQLILNDSQLNFEWNADANEFNDLKLIGGVDLSFHPTDPQLACANLVILNYPELKVIHKEYDWIQLKQPYISGFLAFREVEPLKQLIDQLKAKTPHLIPQIILVDGNGIYHPMKLGLASHLGVLSDIPTIGISKKFMNFNDMSITMDEIKLKLKDFKNINEFIELKGKSNYVYGVALKPKLDLVNPIFVSIGHKISLNMCIQLVLKTSLFRIPEPKRT